MSQDSSSEEDIKAVYDEYLDLAHEYADTIRLTIPEEFYRVYLEQTAHYENLDAARHELDDSGLPSLPTYDMLMALEDISTEQHKVLNKIMEGLQLAIAAHHNDVMDRLESLLVLSLTEFNICGMWGAQRFAEKYVAAYEKARDEVFPAHGLDLSYLGKGSLPPPRSH